MQGTMAIADYVTKITQIKEFQIFATTPVIPRLSFLFRPPIALGRFLTIMNYLFFYGGEAWNV